MSLQPESLRLFLCGDVMTGRGIDQALPHPVNPVSYESYIRDARRFLKHALLGSAAEHVVRYAECPVLIVQSRI